MDILFLSTRIYLGSECNDSNELIHGGIIVTTEGKIRKIMRTAGEVNSYVYTHESEAVFDFEDRILMPGLIDANVHINEPGRKEWEGFTTATKAAAAGGFTTIIDRPQYSIPATTSQEALKTKLATARGKLFIDVGFWGGLINNNSNEIEKMAKSGVIGIQCSLCPLEGFPVTTKSEIDKALPVLDGNLLGFHAEILSSIPLKSLESDHRMYKSFLDTRPASMEIEAVRTICKLSEENKKVRMHILNVSSAEVLPLIDGCKAKGGNITVETCPHYLMLCAENVPESRTDFKCIPPIRSEENREKLWKAIAEKKIDLITSNHCPSSPGAKFLTYGKTRGDFLEAFPGISSLQFGLPLFWTNCQKYGLGISDVYRLFCLNPAKMCGIDSFKGKIEEGYDADFCIWDPEQETIVTKDIIEFTNKANPYMDMKLKGAVHATVVRGLHVYQTDEGFGQPLGRVILRKSSKKLVKFV